MSSTAIFFPDNLTPHLREISFSVFFGGPVEILQWDGGFIVSRGGFGIMPIQDESGFPRLVGVDREKVPILTIEQALNLAARAVRHMNTPPTQEEIQEWANEFCADKSESKADRRTMADFCADLARLLNKEVEPEVPFASYRAMDTFVREAVPSRFLLLFAQPK